MPLVKAKYGFAAGVWQRCTQMAVFATLAKTKNAHGLLTISGHQWHSSELLAVYANHGQRIHRPIFLHTIGTQVLHPCIRHFTLLRRVYRDTAHR